MKVIWVITVLMWYQNIDTPIQTEYLLKSFETKVECLDYVFWNKKTLVKALTAEHGAREAELLKTWAFYCENRPLEEV